MKIIALVSLAVVGGCLSGCINPTFKVHLHVAENASSVVLLKSDDGTETPLWEIGTDDNTGATEHVEIP